MKPNISEFSYGYALTEELVMGFGNKLTSSPVFPSLYQEGKDGGGWDVKLDKGGIPLFLQFKLSDYLKTKSALEYKKGKISLPYYRMHIRSKKYSRQHELLLKLERDGNEVYYSAPGFHEPGELNDAYLKQKVKNRSLWVKPTYIGDITDNKEHCVVFKLPKPHYFCSEPKEIKKDLSFESFQNEIYSAFEERKEYALSRNSLDELVKKIKRLAKERVDDFPEYDSGLRFGVKIPRIDEEIKEIEKEKEEGKTIEKLLINKELLMNHENMVENKFSNKHPIELLAYYASFYFGSQLMTVTEFEK
ncbi:hypothetical protein [Marinicella rhabdoformis]|uniref:hypothetical protein n=1 Tax=Marinicella rhabdoformis TaxID=2580566 RepID=UPI0012AED67A|nr:hypothetical protein [Marinicella rhabdoformis]